MFETVFLFLVKCLWAVIWLGLIVGVFVLAFWLLAYMWQAITGKIGFNSRLF